MFGKKTSLLKSSRELEARNLRLDQESARRRIDREEERRLEDEKVQKLIDPIARIEFSKRFGIKANLFAHQTIEHDEDPLDVPIFSVEYANLMFHPGEYSIDTLRYPRGKYLFSLGEKALRSVKKLFNTDLVVYDRYPGAGRGCEFHAAGQCSGCRNWANVGRTSLNVWEQFNNKRTVAISMPQMHDYNAIVREMDLFNEVASGLALDCGTLSVFGLKPEERQSIIICDNMREVIDSFNKTNGPTEAEYQQNKDELIRATYSRDGQL